MEAQQRSEIGGGPAAIAAVLLLLIALSGCAPMPRGYADQGAAGAGDRVALNAGYYIGADPAFPSGSKGSSP
jgi:hypothetical protein